MESRDNYQEKLSDSASAMSRSLNSTVAYLQKPGENAGDQFDFGWSIPGTDSQISSVFMRISTVADQIQGIPKSAKFLVVPQEWLEDTVSKIDAVQGALTNVVEGIKTLILTNGEIRSIDSSNLQLILTNGSVQETSRNFTRLSSATESLLTSYYRLATVVRPTKSSINFRASASLLEGLIGDFSSQLQNIKEKQSKLSSQIQEIEDVRKSVADQLEKALESAKEAHRQSVEASSDRTTISEYLAEATHNHGRIESTLGDASALEVKIKSASDSIAKFDGAMDLRLQRFSRSEEDLNHLEESLREKEIAAKELISQSEAMLKGSTVAGLASHYQTIHDRLNNNVNSAARSFNLGIFFLFLSLIPLLALVLAPVINPLSAYFYPDSAQSLSILLPEQGETGWQFVGQVLARFIILLPAAWYVRFASIRHSSLFRLREHYNYKYSMAVSVEGFKQQAPMYKEEIAAIILEQLAFNPADRLVPSSRIPEAQIPHPLLRLFDKMIKDRLDKLSVKEG